MNQILFITNYLGKSIKSSSYSSRIRIINNSNYYFDIIAGRKTDYLLIKIINYFNLSLKIFFSFKRKFNLIELHYINPLGFLAVILKKISKKPLMLFIQGSDLEYLPEKYLIFRILTKFTLLNADKIVVLSGQQKDKLINKYSIKAKRIVLGKFGPIMIDIRKVKSSKNSIDCKNKLLFVGSNEIKGGDLFVRAFSYLPPNYRGEMILTDRHYYNGINQLIEDLGFKDRISLFYELSHRELIKRIYRAGIVVIPSRWETICLVALESLLIGRPIVATRVGRINNYLKPGKNGEFTKRRPENIANRIKKVFNDYYKYTEYIEENSNNLLGEYNFDKFSSRLDEIRSELINQ